MNDLDLVTNNTDDMFYVGGKEHNIEEYLHGVDEVLEQIAETREFEVGANTVRSMTSVSRAVGISLAKLLHGMFMLWTEDKDEESFFDYMTDFTTIKRLSMERYIDAWEGVLGIPDKYRSNFLVRPMKDLNALGAAISQGYTPNDSEWKKLSKASNNAEFLGVIRGVKNVAPRKNSITIYLEKNGDIVAWVGETRHAIGYLDLTVEDDVNDKVISRIVKGAGLIKRG